MIVNLYALEACFLYETSIIKSFINHKTYNFDFDIDFHKSNNVNHYFLKKIYKFLKEDVDIYLNNLNEKSVINELNKNNFSNKINSF